MRSLILFSRWMCTFNEFSKPFQIWCTINNEKYFHEIYVELIQKFNEFILLFTNFLNTEINWKKSTTRNYFEILRNCTWILLWKYSKWKKIALQYKCYFIPYALHWDVTIDVRLFRCLCTLHYIHYLSICTHTASRICTNAQRNNLKDACIEKERDIKRKKKRLLSAISIKP